MSRFKMYILMAVMVSLVLSKLDSVFMFISYSGILLLTYKGVL